MGGESEWTRRWFLRSGFQNLLHLALRLEEDALAVLGLPCTSYVYINKGTHGRAEDKPYGREELKYVSDSNTFLVNISANQT